MTHDPVVIVGIARTPQGKFLGQLKDVKAPELGKIAAEAAIKRANLSPNDISDVIMGCVLPAGLGQAPARQVAIYAGLPTSTHCTTLNKMCGSGMQAVISSCQALLSTEPNGIFIAGGMENMSSAPHILPNARTGYRIGETQVFDHMMQDGLEDIYDKGRPMGYFAELCADKYNFTREDQDNYALKSLKRATDAIANNYFKDEIVPVKVKTRKGEMLVENDEHPGSVNPEKIPSLRPAFKKDGTVTAANSSAISDGAAALVLMRESEANKRNLKPIAKILGFSTQSQEPAEFTTAPIGAIKTLLNNLNWSVGDVDLFEINEAFAVVPMAAMQELKIPHDKLNIYGSGCALGHPIGATGARIIVTLINALKNKKLSKGVAALCIGGGEATAVALENIS